MKPFPNVRDDLQGPRNRKWAASIFHAPRMILRPCKDAKTESEAVPGRRERERVPIEWLNAGLCRQASWLCEWRKIISLLLSEWKIASAVPPEGTSEDYPTRYIILALSYLRLTFVLSFLFLARGRGSIEGNKNWSYHFSVTYALSWRALLGGYFFPPTSDGECHVWEWDRQEKWRKPLALSVHL